MTPSILTITGPSCAGKSTLEKVLNEKGFEKLISHTTRAARRGERSGENYHFVDDLTFQRMKNAGEFIETTVFNGSKYSISAMEVKKASSLGKMAIAVVEPHGMKQIRSFCTNNGWRFFSVFLDGNNDEIAARFVERIRYDTHGDIDIYAKRMSAILTIEQCWRRDAWEAEASGSSLYDLVISEFNLLVQSKVLEKIMSLTSSKEHQHA